MTTNLTNLTPIDALNSQRLEIERLDANSTYLAKEADRLAAGLIATVHERQARIQKHDRLLQDHEMLVHKQERIMRELNRRGRRIRKLEAQVAELEARDVWLPTCL